MRNILDVHQVEVEWIKKKKAEKFVAKWHILEFVQEIKGQLPWRADWRKNEAGKKNQWPSVVT